MKLAGFIPEAANKKVTQILLNGAVDQKDLEKRCKFVWMQSF